jgi:hypothetical protein
VRLAGHERPQASRLLARAAADGWKSRSGSWLVSKNPGSHEARHKKDATPVVVCS